MTKETKKRERLIISEDANHNPKQKTTEARSQLYQLIARFRKNAEQTDDRRTRTTFEFAAEIIAGLVRAFKRHEERIEDDSKLSK